MSQMSHDDLFRQAAEVEGGMPVSAGARIIHVRTAAEKGRAFYVDLSGIPEERRAAVILQIKELVQRASPSLTSTDAPPAPEKSQSGG